MPFVSKVVADFLIVVYCRTAFESGSSAGGWERNSMPCCWDGECICIQVEEMECHEGSPDGDFHCMSLYLSWFIHSTFCFVSCVLCLVL